MTETIAHRPAVKTAVRRLTTHPLIQPDRLTPSRDDFEVVGVFNPGAVGTADGVVLLVRVAERPAEVRPGFTALPRWDAAGGIVVDWVPDDELKLLDPRVAELKEDGTIRLTFISHLRVVRCGDGRSVREVTDVTIEPDGELSEYGVEDPRITEIDGRFYVTYVTVSRHGPATALASTTDFQTFEKHGIIFCPENKDVVLFPEKIGGSYWALHRPVCKTPFTRPEMWLAKSPDLIHWGSHVPLVVPGGDWQSGHVGGGVPPIRVPEGLLTIYHGNTQPAVPGGVGAYYGGAFLLDADNPTRVLGQLPEPLLAPEELFEVEGFMPNVVFPTGVVQEDDTLLVYYGAADTCIGVAEFSTQEILDAMGGHGPGSD
jgi:predicted GH43/DUF377 family glycosyl hydrolase